MPHFDLVELIRTVGYLGVFTIVFLESGLLIGFFFPGDSVLFTAGFLASQGFLDIKILIAGCFIFAVLGDSIGYYIGKTLGPKIFTRENSIFFHRKHLERANRFYEKHGGKTIILARFIPVIRAFAPVVAGAGKMNYKRFVFFNFFGGILWAIGVTLAGFYLGSLIPDVDKYLLPIVGLIVIASVLPGLHHMLTDAELRASLIKRVKRS
ncbi:MAG: VTT domain-containing protein [Candidatus Daviesbacteria bacterium]|nr:VTT domain-containing protein [Candidatus Daviesbacteria bacterium]